jgi:hypothetical protein
MYFRLLLKEDVVNLIFDIVKITVPILIAVTGWVLGHWFNSKRDLRNKKREIIIQFNLDTFVLLSNAVHRDNNDYNHQIEEALSKIQLLGTSRQALLARQIATDIADKGVADMDELLNDLRMSIRNELELEGINENYKWLRFNDYS